MEQYCHIEIESCFSLAKKAEGQIIAEALRHGYCEQTIFALRLSLEEALTNAIRHGNKKQTQKKVCVDYKVTNTQIDIKISDEGVGFTPGAVPDPTSETQLSTPSGRGVLLMQAYMDEVTFNDKGNEVHLVKRNSDPDALKYHTITSFGKLNVKVSGDKQQTTVILSGSAEMVEAQELDVLLDKTTQEGHCHLIIDLSGLLFTCSIGLGALIKAQTHCQKQAGQLVLVAPQPPVQRVLETTRLDRLFNIAQTLSEATSQFKISN